MIFMAYQSTPVGNNIWIHVFLFSVDVIVVVI